MNARGVGQEEIPVAIIGAGNDVLIGGNDRLSGDQGRDLLIRGIGKDSLQAGQEEDILIGGDFANSRDAGALDSIMAIWGQQKPQAQRIDQLRTTGLNSQNILDNQAVDKLLGEGDLDWFWALTSDNCGSQEGRATTLTVR